MNDANGIFGHEKTLYQSLETDPGTLDEEILAELLKAANWKRNPMSRKLVRAQRPDFDTLERRALDAFTRTRHAGPLAYLMLSGLGGGSTRLARVADLGKFWLGEGWEALHPVDEDETDSYARMSLIQRALPGIVAKTALETAPAVMHGRMGPVTLGTILAATGRAKPVAGDPDIPLQAFKDAFSDQPDGTEVLEQAALAYEHTRICMEEMSKAFGHREVYESATFREKMLDVVAQMCGQATEALRAVAEGVTPRSENSEDGSGVSLDAATTAPQPSADAVTSRDQAYALMDAIVEFYAQNARSSPVPLGLIALRDLMDSDLNGWIRTTAPKGLVEAGLRLDTLDAKVLDVPVKRASTVGSGVDLSRLERLVSHMAHAIDKAAEAAVAEIVAVGMTKPASETDADDSNMTDVEKMKEKMRIKDVKIKMSTDKKEKMKGEEEHSAKAEKIAKEDAGKAIAKAFENLRSEYEALRSEIDQTIPSPSDDATEPPPVTMAINNRKDVKKFLKELEKFFSEDEPSSPAAIYMRRLNNLVDADFSKIVNTVMIDGKGPVIQLSS